MAGCSATQDECRVGSREGGCGNARGASHRRAPLAGVLVETRALTFSVLVETRTLTLSVLGETRTLTFSVLVETVSVLSDEVRVHVYLSKLYLCASSCIHPSPIRSRLSFYPSPFTPIRSPRSVHPLLVLSASTPDSSSTRESESQIHCQNAVCCKWKTRTSGVFDWEFGFHSHGWRCSDSHPPFSRKLT